MRRRREWGTRREWKRGREWGEGESGREGERGIGRQIKTLSAFKVSMLTRHKISS